VSYVLSSWRLRLSDTGWCCAGKREAVDEARVNLGMAKGNAKMGQFMTILSYDMSSLLQVRVCVVDASHAPVVAIVG
jgi:hypothetical protein